jgi:hypothetical protein
MLFFVLQLSCLRLSSQSNVSWVPFGAGPKGHYALHGEQYEKRHAATSHPTVVQVRALTISVCVCVVSKWVLHGAKQELKGHSIRGHQAGL